MGGPVIAHLRVWYQTDAGTVITALLFSRDRFCGDPDSMKRVTVDGLLWL